MAVPVFEAIKPTDSEIELARKSGRQLAACLRTAGEVMELRLLASDGQDEVLRMPASAARMLLRILAEMSDGHGVGLISAEAELSSQEAADVLNVSRPYLVKLLDEGRIPCHRVGSHRRVLLDDVMAFEADRRQMRGAALDGLSQLDHELGLG